MYIPYSYVEPLGVFLAFSHAHWLCTTHAVRLTQPHLSSPAKPSVKRAQPACPGRSQYTSPDLQSTPARTAHVPLVCERCGLTDIQMGALELIMQASVEFTAQMPCLA